MVVGHSDHEGFDKRRLAPIDRIGDDRLELALRPRAGGGDGLWQAQCRPIIHTVNEIAEIVLERVVADRVGLTDQDLGFGRQYIAAGDGASERFEHVVAVEHCLTDQRAA
ncbi:MAG: hypothetical protein ACREPE_15690 [Lysobacter sp.]